MTQNEDLNRYLKALGFKEMTEVEKKVLPLSLEHKNLVVQSSTGSGKTHAYLLPIFMLLDKENHDLQAVITAPTRELAKQIYEMARLLFELDKIDVRLYVGGDELEKSAERLQKSNPQIAIGTPGRIKELGLDRGLLHLFMAKTFIIDEADMTLDSGFIPIVDKILAVANNVASIQIYSATIPESITPFLKKYLSILATQY